eukprot:1039389-Pleurochrysis_carterae.AAC.1
MLKRIRKRALNAIRGHADAGVASLGLSRKRHQMASARQSRSDVTNRSLAKKQLNQQLHGALWATHTYTCS